MQHTSQDYSIGRSSGSSVEKGFRRAGHVLRRQHPELLVSKRKLRQTETIQMLREKRKTETQNLGFSSRPFVLCGLPVKRPDVGCLLHERRNGQFVLQVTGHPSYGLPWSQDRLVPIFLATLAIRQGTPRITFESAAQILDTFAMQQGGTQYRRLVGAFQRIFGATIFFGSDTQGERATVLQRARFNFMSEARIWYSRDPDQKLLPGDCQNVIVLSDEFYREILNHPIPTDLEAAKALSSSPAALDLFMWLSYRSFTARGRERIPLVGSFGLISQLGVPTMRALESSAKSWRAGSIWFAGCGPSVPLRLTRMAPVCFWTRRMPSFRREELMHTVEQRPGIWSLSLEQIEATVADHLGRGRVPGNRTGPCFSRQISMYLAKNVGGWSTTRIGRFYKGRHHTTVLHAIEKIERLRRMDESVDALIEELTAVLSPSMEGRFTERFEPGWSTALIEAVAARVLNSLAGRLPEVNTTCLLTNRSD